ncbi:MAG: PAS domain S-box protein [Chitinophagaceae bacterium]|nr:PAS domain S-box protein [Chitinophagaceae bacterium]
MKKIFSNQTGAIKNQDYYSRYFAPKTATLLFVIIMVMLLVTSFLSFNKIKQYENSVKSVIHTNLVKGKLSELFSNLKEAETGQRGYLLTHDSSFLEPYIATENISKQVIKELDSLVKDHPVQQKNLNNLRRLVSERTFILKRNLGLVFTNTANANNLNALLQGKNKMGEVRKQVAVMLQVEDELLQQRLLQKNKIAVITPFFLLAIFLLSIFALTLFFIRWRRETQLRIEAQQKAIKLAEASESRIEDFFKEMPAGLCLLKGPEHIFEFANNAYFELVGTPDIIGKPVSQVFPEVESQGFITLLDNVYKTGKTFIGDETPLIINQSGRKHQYVDFSYQAFKDIDGEIEGILVFAYNVTEKINARKEIEENEQALQKIATHLKLATDSANVGTWSLNVQTQKLEWSELHKKIWGYDKHRTDLTYENWYKIILPEDREKAFKKIAEAKVNDTVYDAEYRISRANDESVHYVRSVGRYYYNVKGEAETLTGISIDITEQKEAEEKIKEARELFETTLRNVPSAIYHFDKTGKILYLNEIGANQIGYATIEEVLAEKDVFQLRKRAYETFTVLNEQGKPMPVDQNSTALTFKTGKSAEVVSQLIHKKTGASLWLLSKTSPFYDNQGGLVKVLATSTDITVQKTSEQNIRQSEEQFRTFADSIQNLAWIANADGWVYWYNQRWYDYTGATHQEMEGWGWQKALHPDHIKKIVEIITAAWKKDQPFELTFPLRRYDGEYRWFLTRVYPVKDSNGNIERWIGTNTDITTQKNFSEELEKKVNERTAELSERNTFIETLIDSSLDLIIAFDKDLCYLSMNKAANRIFAEHFPDSVIGKRMDEVIPHVKQSGAYANAQSALKGNIIFQKGYKSFYDNKYFDVDFIPLRNEKEVYGVMTISRDVTENVLAAEELKTKNLALENLNAELQSFTFIASHDLQEPLRKIQMFSKRIIEAEILSDKTQDYFNRIIAAGQHMQNLIVSLLDFSRTDKAELNIVPCDLNAIVEESKSDLHLSIVEKQARIEYENLPTINGLHIQLSQLFTNLIDNAIKYSRPETIPHIKITAERIHGREINHPAAIRQLEYYAIKIADNGIGFEKEYAAKIFELFQRLHGRNEYSGTGIGLAIVKKIVTNHNGFIIAAGQPNVGSTFTLYLPTA